MPAIPTPRIRNLCSLFCAPLRIESILLRVRPRAADDFGLDAEFFCQGEGKVHPCAGGGLGSGDEGGEVLFGAGVVFAVLAEGLFDSGVPCGFCGALEGAADAVYFAGVVAGEAEEALPVARVFFEFVEGHCFSFSSRCSRPASASSSFAALASSQLRHFLPSSRLNS